MLLLFDVDATLITSSGAGIDAMEEAGRVLCSSAFTREGTEFSGRLDPLILTDLLVNNGLEPSADLLAAFREEYRRQLQRRLNAGLSVVRLLPGVQALLTALAAEERLMIGLLTGNFEETGRIKLVASGLDLSPFKLFVWGDESRSAPPTRDDLPRVAFTRYRELSSLEISPHRVTIIGDTPHDVRCAMVNGCRSLAVATGRFSSRELAEAGAHRVESDLSDTASLVRWLSAGGD